MYPEPASVKNIQLYSSCSISPRIQTLILQCFNQYNARLELCKLNAKRLCLSFNMLHEGDLEMSFSRLLVTRQKVMLSLVYKGSED